MNYSMKLDANYRLGGISNEKPTLTDSLSSLYTSLGENTGSVSYLSGRKRLRDTELSKMYRNSWVTARYINKLIEDMLKLERVFSGDITEEIKKVITSKEKRTGLDKALAQVLIWGALFGDSLLVAITDADGEEMIKPLDEEAETLSRFIVFAKPEYTLSKDVTDDITSPLFGQPISYKIKSKNGLEVHASRCYRLRLGEALLTGTEKHGFSDIQPAYDTIKMFELTLACIADLLQDSNVDILSVPDLLNMISAGRKQVIVDYALMMKRTKSSTGMMLLDAGDATRSPTYTQKTVNFSGLSDILVKAASSVSGALNMPLTVLFGESANGFSSGEEDASMYHEMVLGRQEQRLRPLYNFTDKFIMKGVIKELPDFEFPKIDIPNATEEATNFTTYSNGVTALVNAQILSPQQALKELSSKKILKTITDEDVEELADVRAEIGFDYRSSGQSEADETQ